MEAILFNVMESKGFGAEYTKRYKMVNQFHQERRPLIILVCGAPCTGCIPQPLPRFQLIVVTRDWLFHSELVLNCATLVTISAFYAWLFHCPRSQDAVRMQTNTLLTVILCGAGKSSLAQQLASRFNMPNVLQTDMFYEVCPSPWLSHVILAF